MEKGTIPEFSQENKTAIGEDQGNNTTDANAILNWAGNYTYSTKNLFYANRLDEVQAFVKEHAKLKVLGSRHCFNNIADTSHDFLSLKQLDSVVSIDEQSATVTVEAGVTYGKLAPYLHSKGFALHNLASLPHISIAGAFATATHGSGIQNGNLATAVTALEIITAAGDVEVISREKNPEIFAGCVVNLGALGVVTKVTLKMEPAFLMQQTVFENLPLQQLEAHLDEVLSGGYSVSLFTDWKSDTFNQAWVKQRITEGVKIEKSDSYYGAVAAKENLHPIGTMSPVNCTEQMGEPGEWFERMPHFKMGFTPSSGKELQSEYFVPYELGYKALLAISQIKKHIAPQLQISEIRAIAADDFWMSPCYQQDSMTIHFTWQQNWPEVQQILPLIEEALAPFNARPHWGKLFTMSPLKLKTLYKRLPDFQRLLLQYDPNGKFKNEFLEKYIIEN